MLSFSFHEVMEGTLQRAGERFDRPFRFEFQVDAPSVLGFATTAVGDCVGTVRIDGLAKHAPARGTLELSPLARKTIRYTFEFTGDDGRRYSFDGEKRTTLRRHVRGWTTLPGAVYDDAGKVWGEALLRFSLRRHLRGLLRSIRVGQPARLAHG
jgi:hypothetical protein